MPKFGCSCGHVINLVASPTPDEFVLLSEATIQDMIDCVIDGGAYKEDPSRKLDGPAVIRCPRCARLWVEHATDPGRFEAFVKEHAPSVQTTP